MSYVHDNFELLSGIAKCVAAQFGNSCEVVLHDLTLPYDHTIVAIENGHITGRKIGGSGTNIGLEVLRGTVDDENRDRYNYVNFTPNGRILRSSSKYFTDAAGAVVGSLCINLDITDLVQAQKTLHYAAFLGNIETGVTKEVFTSNVDDLLGTLLEDSLRVIGKPIASMTKDDKVQAIRYLDAKGAFLIKKSAEKAADFFGISKFTLYNYLEKEEK